MVSVIKSMVVYGAIACRIRDRIVVDAEFPALGGSSASDHDATTRPPVFCFTAGGFLPVWTLGPGSTATTACFAREGSMSRAMRGCIECSSMAYSNEGYELLQKINQVANRKER
jgi:hypothetical protein